MTDLPNQAVTTDETPLTMETLIQQAISDYNIPSAFVEEYSESGSDHLWWAIQNLYINVQKHEQ